MVLTFLLGFVLSYLLSTRIMVVIEAYHTPVQAVEPFLWTFGDSTELVKNESIEYRLIERSPLMVAVYSNHPLSRRDSLQRSELHGERLLFMTPSSTGDSVSDLRFYEMYEQAGYHPDIFFRSNDVESILMMVSIEEGISIIPSYVTHKLTNAENLVFIPLIGEEEVVEIIAAWKRSSGNLALQQFLGHYPLLKAE